MYFATVVLRCIFQCFKNPLRRDLLKLNVPKGDKRSPCGTLATVLNYIEYRLTYMLSVAKQVTTVLLDVDILHPNVNT